MNTSTLCATVYLYYFGSCLNEYECLACIVMYRINYVIMVVVWMILSNDGCNAYDVKKRRRKERKKGDRYEWKIHMTLISYPGLDC